MNIMYDKLDDVEVKEQLVLRMLLFVVLFIIMGVALIDMFTGAVVETFSSCQWGAVCWLPTAPS